MSVALRRQLVNLAAALTMIGTLGGLAFGLPAVDRALPAERPAPTGPYPIGAGVTVVPPAGAAVDVTRTRPGAHGGAALFVIGPVRYAVVVEPGGGSLDGAADRLRHKLAANPGYRLAGTDTPAVTSSGVAGRQGSYTSPGRDGRWTVFDAGGLAIEVTVSGAADDLARALPAVDASTRSLHVPAAG
jgi:hypothetical protein